MFFLLISEKSALQHLEIMPQTLHRPKYYWGYCAGGSDVPPHIIFMLSRGEAPVNKDKTDARDSLL